LTDDEDPVDEELGAPDPEATGNEALDTLGEAPAQQPPPEVAPPPAITGQPGQELAPPQVIPAPSAVPAGTHATKGTRTVTALAPNADIVGGQAAEQKVFRDERKLAGDQAELQGKAAQIEQERAEKIADETARQNAEIQAEQLHQAELAQQRAQQYSRDIDELKRSKPPGGFSQWAGGKKAFADISIALGGLLAGREGTANLALANVNQRVEQENRLYQQGVENQFRVLQERHGLNHELDNQAKDALAQGQARKVMAIDSLNKYADAQLKALGVPAAQQAGVKAQLGLDKMAADAQQKYGQLLASKVTDTTKFAPGKGGGAGAPSDALSKLHEFARLHTGPDQEAQVVAEAERLFPGMGAKPEKLQTLVAGAVKASADAKKSGGDSTVTLDNGEQLALPSPRAVPQFVKGYNSRIQAAQKIRELLTHVKEVGASPWGIDDASRRKALIHDANIAVGSISSMGQSDHSTHLELGTLGEVAPRQTPFLHPSDKVAVKLLEDKLRQIEEGTDREIHTFRKGSGAFEGGREKPAKPADQKTLADEWASATPIGKASR
jgi:hypothetical protein